MFNHESGGLFSSDEIRKLVNSLDDLLEYVVPTARELYGYEGDENARSFMDFLLKQATSGCRFLINGQTVTRVGLKNTLAVMDQGLAKMVQDYEKWQSL